MELKEKLIRILKEKYGITIPQKSGLTMQTAAQNGLNV